MDSEDNINYKGFKQRHKDMERELQYHYKRHQHLEGDPLKDYLLFVPSEGVRTVSRLQAYYKRRLKWENWQQEITESFIDHILEHLT